MTAAKVMVLYPKEFGCQPKFVRKLNSLLQHIPEFELAFFEDPRGYLAAQGVDERCVGLTRLGSLEGVTHAIVFDDGEEFPDTVQEIRKVGIPCRVVPIKIARVINIKRESQFARQKSSPTYEYIGRGSEWGNPHSMYDAAADGVDSRAEVIRKFEYDFQRGLLRKSKEDAKQLAGKRLGCFCKPDTCHGDIIAEYLNSLDDEL